MAGVMTADDYRKKFNTYADEEAFRTALEKSRQAPAQEIISILSAAFRTVAQKHPDQNRTVLQHLLAEDMIEGYMLFADACAQQKNPAKAQESFAAALAINPINISALKKYGRFLEIQGNSSQALIIYNKALATKPEDIESAMLKARALCNLGYTSEASRLIRPIVKENTHNWHKPVIEEAMIVFLAISDQSDALRREIYKAADDPTFQRILTASRGLAEKARVANAPAVREAKFGGQKQNVLVHHK